MWYTQIKPNRNSCCGVAQALTCDRVIMWKHKEIDLKGPTNNERALRVCAESFLNLGDRCAVGSL